VDTQHDVVRLVVVLSADLTLVDTLVRRSNVLNDQAPLVHALVVVDADASVRSERKMTDRQRMNLIKSLPRDLDHTTHGSRTDIDREFVTSAKKPRILTNFPKLKKS